MTRVRHSVQTIHWLHAGKNGGKHQTRQKLEGSRQTLTRITQLFPNLELLSEGDPQHNTLFVLGRGIDPPLGDGDELLLVDPPADVRSRFTLPNRVVAVATTGTPPAGLPTLAPEPGGVAHVRIGAHLVDLYSFANHTIIHLPAVGLICGGGFGQRQTPPTLQQGDGGEEEIEVLRLLARLVRERSVQLYVPQVGEPNSDVMQVMSALAEDVGYIHSLRRNVNAIARTGDGLNAALAIADSLLPPHWSSPQAKAVNVSNISALYAVAVHQHN